MTDHTFTAEAFLRLALDVYNDGSREHEAYATVFGGAATMEVRGSRVLHVSGADHAVTIDFSSYEGVMEDPDNGVYRCAWLDSVPDTGSARPRFVNCVFTRDVDLGDVRGAEFHSCFFLGDMLCQGCADMDFLRLDGCLVHGYLTVRSCRVGSLKMVRCNAGGMLVDDVRVTSEAIVSSCRAEDSFTMTSCTFRGDILDIDGITVGNGMGFRSCASLCPMRIASCEAGHVSMTRCRLDSLEVDGVHLSTYSDTVGTDTMVPEDSRIGMSKVSVVNGASFRDITATGAILMGCMFDKGCGFHSGDGTGPTIQVLEILDTRFGGPLTIDPVYVHLGMSDPIMDGPVRIDHAYNRITSGPIIGRTDPGCRMFTRDADGIARDVDPDVLLSISESMARSRRFEESERYYISYKVRMRDDASPLRRTAMYGHELVSRFGKSPARVLAMAVVALFAFALLYYMTGMGTMEDCIYFSGYTFFTIGFGEVGPMTSFSKYLTIVQGGVGVVLMTYFVTTMCNRRR